MPQNPDAELIHMLKTIGLRFEQSIARQLPADGSLMEDFENWQWAFSRLMDHPGHEMLEQSTRESFAILHKKLSYLRTPSTGGRPKK